MAKRKQDAAQQTIARSSDSFQQALQTLLQLSSEWYWEQDENYRFTAFTGAEIERTGIDTEGYLGTTRWDKGAVPLGDDNSWDQHRAVLESRQPFRDFVYSRIDATGELRRISASGDPVFAADGAFLGYRGVAKDVTEKVRGEALLRLEHNITRFMTEADSTSSAINDVIQAICTSEGWECGDWWSVDEQASLRRLDYSWGVDTLPIQRFIAQSRGMVLPTFEGNVGRALQTAQPLWIADMAGDRSSARGKIAQEAGLRALFILPIMIREKVLAAIAFNSRQIREPDERFLQAVRVIGSQIGQFLQRKQAEEVLRESEERFRSLTELSSDLYWEQDEHHRFTSVRGMGNDWTSARGVRSLGKTRWELNFVNMTAADWADHISLLDARKPFRDLELCRVDEAGAKVWVSVAGEPIFDASGKFTGYRGIGKDISARKHADERIQFLAHHDGLTALPNRTLFGELLNLAIRQARRYSHKFALLFIDLDRFKAINDTFGHDAGDALLQEMSRRLIETLRDSDVVARLGGDEFVVIVHEVREPNQVEAVARKVISAVVKPLIIQGQECRVTASIGISMYPADATDEQSLMKNADIAMYHAKEEGKNTFQFYSEGMDIHSFERLAIENSLLRALERDEFLLHYQAKLSLKSGGITGVEALLRWRHPDLGMVSPAQFVPIAEETGLIIHIGRWVLKTACAQNMAWQSQGLPPISVAVNISARQFADENLLQDIAQALEQSGLAPELLELELNESMVMRNPERAGQLLAAMKRLGVRLAIDDFGIGYASLANLKRFQIDTLKVDRSFIRDIPADDDDRAIAEAIVTMGKSLQLNVIAEGVETKEQMAFLQLRACDEVQGFYFSEPIEHDEFAKLLWDHNAGHGKP